MKMTDSSDSSKGLTNTVRDPKPKKQGSATKRWLLTENNPTEEMIAEYVDFLKVHSSGIISKEVGTSQTEHIHIYFVMNVKCRFTAVKSRFPRANIKQVCQMKGKRKIPWMEVDKDTYHYVAKDGDIIYDSLKNKINKSDDSQIYENYLERMPEFMDEKFPQYNPIVAKCQISVMAEFCSWGMFEKKFIPVVITQSGRVNFCKVMYHYHREIGDKKMFLNKNDMEMESHIDPTKSVLDLYLK